MQSYLLHHFRGTLEICRKHPIPCFCQPCWDPDKKHSKLTGYLRRHQLPTNNSVQQQQYKRNHAARMLYNCFHSHVRHIPYASSSICFVLPMLRSSYQVFSMRPSAELSKGFGEPCCIPCCRDAFWSGLTATSVPPVIMRKYEPSAVDAKSTAVTEDLFADRPQ